VRLGERFFLQGFLEWPYFEAQLASRIPSAQSIYERV